MKPKEIIINAFQREADFERGLKIITPDEELAKSHHEKADHNLVVMTDLNKLNHSDWVVIAAYYAMYHAATALLSRIGLDSKDHATTVAILEYFFSEKIEKSLLDKFNEIEEQKDKFDKLKLEDKYINYLWKTKKTRESMQYGIETTFKETDLIMKNAKDFALKIKLLLAEINDEFVEVIADEAKELHDSIKNDK
jgi:uncharacterized protein (UPF0332 family)